MVIPLTMYHDVGRKWLTLKIFVYSNVPQLGLELGSLGQQAHVLPFEPHLLVEKEKLWFDLIN